jgi:hypothetical protein
MPSGRLVLSRAPRPILQPFVETLWAVEATSASPSAPARREHVLPTGQMHLAFRLSGDPLRLFVGANDTTGYLVGDAVVGGARVSHYIRLVQPGCSVGAQLHPGAAETLFGVPADEIAGRHTPLPGFLGPRGGLDARAADGAADASPANRQAGVHPYLWTPTRQRLCQ